MHRRRYTQEMLQLEADRWIPELKLRGFGMSVDAVTVFTSGIRYERARGLPPSAGPSLAGQADLSIDGLPIVYVRLNASRKVDPLVTLIHELLHFVEPELPHDEIYSLSETLRRTDARSLVPDSSWNTEEEPRLEQRRSQEAIALGPDVQVRALEALDRIWLKANGFLPTPMRSYLTGRFIRTDRREPR